MVKKILIIITTAILINSDKVFKSVIDLYLSVECEIFSNVLK